MLLLLQVEGGPTGQGKKAMINGGGDGGGGAVDWELLCFKLIAELWRRLHLRRPR